MIDFQRLPKPVLRLIQFPPQILYRFGLGFLIGHRILLLITTGRKSGLPRVTPLQYDEIDDVFYIGSMRGLESDWFRNIVANPKVKLRIGRHRLDAVAEPVTDQDRIANFLAGRLEKHPRMMRVILRAAGYSSRPTRDELRAYAKDRALVVIRPTGRTLDS